MTDEEKAEEYVKEKICGDMELNLHCPYSSCSSKECVAKVSFLAGLESWKKRVADTYLEQ